MAERKLMAQSELCRTLAVPVFDSAAWIVALTIACLLRDDFALSGLLTIGLLSVVSQPGVGAVSHLYRSRYWLGTIDEASASAANTAAAGLVVFATNAAAAPPWVAHAVPLEGALLALAIMGAARLGYRRTCEHRLRPQNCAAEAVLVFGAGSAGQQLSGRRWRTGRVATSRWRCSTTAPASAVVGWGASECAAAGATSPRWRGRRARSSW